MKLDEVEVPVIASNLPLPPLQGSDRQVKWAESLRPRMLGSVATSNPKLAAAMRSIDDATWWIANQSRSFSSWTWPKEWSKPDSMPFQQMRKDALSDVYPGAMAERLKSNRDNPREVAFAEQWLYENDWEARRHLLDNMLAPIDRTNGQPERSYRSDTGAERVAATVVQWLGSNVGMCFLEEVMKRSPAVRAWFKQRVFSDGGDAKALPPVCPHCGSDLDE